MMQYSQIEIPEVDMKKMTIDEQVALLMQGTEYGDEHLSKAMASELRERLVEAEKEKPSP